MNSWEILNWKTITYEKINRGKEYEKSKEVKIGFLDRITSDTMFNNFYLKRCISLQAMHISLNWIDGLSDDASKNYARFPPNPQLADDHSLSASLSPFSNFIFHLILTGVPERMSLSVF
jgi:hypothetical protein